MKDHTQEIRAGRRFAFGANWARFLAVVDDERIGQAEESLKAMLDVNRLEGKTFLDAGSDRRLDVPLWAKACLSKWWPRQPAGSMPELQITLY